MSATRTRTARMIGYTRVSTSEQADSGLGLAAQAVAIESAAASRDWKLEMLTDAGYSAKDLHRPAIQSALVRLAAGEADGLVVAKLDRLSRSLVDFVGVVARAHAEGWTLVALDLGVDTSTPAGTMMANTLANFAQYERDLIRARTRDAQAEKAKGGRAHKGGARPFGFAADFVTHDPAEAAACRDAARRLLAGESVSAVVRAWNAAGITTPAQVRRDGTVVPGGPWRTGGFMRFLASPRLAGLRDHHGTLHTAEWEPIIDEGTWAALVARRGAHNNFTRPAHMLTGLVRCGACTTPMGASQANGARTYRCDPRHRGGCGSVSIKGEPAEDFVVAAAAVWVEDNAEALAARLAVGELRLDAVELEAGLAEARARRSEGLRNRLRYGKGAAAEVDEVLAELSADIERMERALTGAQTPQPSALLTRGADIVEHHRKAKAGDPVALAKLRAALAGVIESVTVAPAVRGKPFDTDRLAIHWVA